MKMMMIMMMMMMTSIKVIYNDTDRSGRPTYDFLFVMHGPVSYRFRDKRRFRLKIANFPIARERLS